MPEFTEIVKLLEKGVAVHHSGVTPVFREMIEILYRKQYIKLLVATETFAVGVNVAIKSVIYTVVVFVIIILGYQIYLFKHNEKILGISILYDQAKDNINSDEFDHKMNLIAQENGIYGILASLELIKYKLRKGGTDYDRNIDRGWTWPTWWFFES